MPLSQNVYERPGVLNTESSLNLINILNEDRLSGLRNPDTTTIKRLINVYPETNDMHKPDLIKRILPYYWRSEHQLCILEKVSQFERYLLALNKREHFIHQFEVMLLGLHVLYLLNDKVKDTNSLFHFDSWEKIYYTWTIVAMGHDFGYPYEVATELLSELSSLYSSLNMLRIGESLDIILGKLKRLNEDISLLTYSEKRDRDEIIKEYFDNKKFLFDLLLENLGRTEKETSELESQLIADADHGYVSALLLSHSALEKFYSKSSGKDLKTFLKSHEYEILCLASGAISTHSLKEPYRHYIDFQKNPYGFLLHLLDNVHDWNRSVFSNEEWPIYELCKFERNDNNIVIKQILWDDCWPDEMVERVLASLNKKKDYLENLKGSPSPPNSINIIIEFTFSTVKISDKIEIVVRL